MNKIRDINKMLYYMALGDSNGFPFENMSPKLIKKINPKIKERIIIKGNPFTDDMITDDTEHMLFTWQALKNSAHVENSFELWKSLFTNHMESQFKKWFATFPAGIGKSTLISCFKMTFGKHYPESGYYSAGNGPLMRAPLLGLYFHDDDIKRRESVKISTLLTHTHPFSILTAQAISEITALLKNRPELRNNKEELLNMIFSILYYEKSQVILNDKDNETWHNTLSTIHSLNNLQKDVFLKNTFPKGVSGFCIHTLIICIAQLYYNDRIEDVLKDTLYSGGDTDTSSGISASVFSLFIQDEININISKMEKRITNPYLLKLFFSSVGWFKSFSSLARFLYIFKP